MRRTLSVRLSVRPSCYRYRASRHATRITMTHMYFSARAEGRISYGHLGRTDSCLVIKLQPSHVIYVHDPVRMCDSYDKYVHMVSSSFSRLLL